MKTKKNSTASQLPNIYRIFTENNALYLCKKIPIRPLTQSNYKEIVNVLFKLLVFVIFVILIFATTILIYFDYQKSSKLKDAIYRREKIQNQINFWQSVLQKYPGYKDAYFRIAFLQYQIKDFSGAKENVKKALLLDPNYTDAKKLDAMLDK
jgi:tetratricopeptide (TPR) repeat protein